MKLPWEFGLFLTAVPRYLHRTERREAGGAIRFWGALSLLNYVSRFLYGNHADVAGYPQMRAGVCAHVAIFVWMAAVA